MRDVKHSDYANADYTEFWSSTEYIYYDFVPLLDSISGKIITELKTFYSKSENRKKTNCVNKPYYFKYSGGYYLNNRKEGNWECFFRDGTVSTKLRFENGIPVDTIFYYSQTGDLERKIIPIDNWIFLELKLNEEGSIVSSDTTFRNDYHLIFD